MSQGNTYILFTSQCRSFVKIISSCKNMSQPSLAVRIEDFPKHLDIPFQKSDITSAIIAFKKQKKDVGVNNYPVKL